jgi:hypothetical protein
MISLSCVLDFFCFVLASSETESSFYLSFIFEYYHLTDRSQWSSCSSHRLLRQSSFDLTYRTSCRNNWNCTQLILLLIHVTPQAGQLAMRASNGLFIKSSHELHEVPSSFGQEEGKCIHLILQTRRHFEIFGVGPRSHFSGTQRKTATCYFASASTGLPCLCL